MLILWQRLSFGQINKTLTLRLVSHKFNKYSKECPLPFPSPFNPFSPPLPPLSHLPPLNLHRLPPKNLRPSLIKSQIIDISIVFRQMKHMSLSESDSGQSLPNQPSQKKQTPAEQQINPLQQPDSSYPHKHSKKICKACKAHCRQSTERSTEERRGRPSKSEQDKQYSKRSKKLNDVIYHYSRLLIFLFLMKGKQDGNHALTLTAQQNQWINEATALMHTDNFPAPEERSLSFLLHPNSLHFILDYNKTNKNDTQYHPDRMKYYLFAFLIKRNLLTRNIWKYLTQYWNDIVHLVNKSTRERLALPRQENYVEYGGEEGAGGMDTAETMRKEMEEDASIAAYEIACYLEACCRLFRVEIRRN